MITFNQLIESVSYKNQKHFSKRTDSERRALHSQFRQLNKTDDAAANSNPRPWTDDDYKNLEKWAKSRENDPGFKEQTNQAKYSVALHKQKGDKTKK